VRRHRRLEQLPAAAATPPLSSFSCLAKKKKKTTKSRCHAVLFVFPSSNHSHSRMYRNDVSRVHDMPPGRAARLNPVEYVCLNVDSPISSPLRLSNSSWDQSGGGEHRNRTRSSPCRLPVTPHQCTAGRKGPPLQCRRRPPQLVLGMVNSLTDGGARDRPRHQTV
jgi:hypothetical protein